MADLLLQIGIMAIYTCLLCWLIQRIAFFRQSGLSKQQLIGIFLVKIAAGCVYGCIHLYYYGGADTWSFFDSGRMIYDTIFINPWYYIELTFGPNARIPPYYLCEILEPIPFWSDVRTYSMLRINALLHLISGGYYYVHVVFWAFFSFCGLLALYRTFNYFFPEKHFASCFVLFFVPSILFWTSGIHKSGISFLAIGLMCYHFYHFLQYKNRLKRLLYMTLCAALLSIVRPYILMLLLPALTSCFWTYYYPKYSFTKFVFVYFIYIIALLNAYKLHPKLDILARVYDAHYYFVVYKPGTGDIPINMLSLENKWTFVQQIPQAFFNAAFRPLLLEVNSLVQAMSAIEMTFLIVFMLLCLGFNRFREIEQRCFLYTCLFFAVTYFIFVGWIVDNLGAIVRYRAIGLPFFLGFFVFILDWNRLKRRFSSFDFFPIKK